MGNQAELTMVQQAREIESLKKRVRELEGALDECQAAMYGMIGVDPNLQDIGNVAHAMELARKALLKGE